ncbi:MAG: hypothetical protein K8S25_11220 [Alphaproteobacteria bacterium]|nr:hypothetical protein [Alphaproteobacteria bacterium]
MTQTPTDQAAAKKNLNRLWKLFLPLAGVTGALSFVALLYFGYDLAKGTVSPCESIFQQTTVGLSTKIKFLKAEGELKLGPEKVAELSERAQMTALDLKTCCTVLDAGRIDPEQFLACKSKARSYDARIEDVTALIKAALPTATAATPAPALEAAVVAARTVSQDFNEHVVKVAAEQQLKTLQAAPAAQLSVDAAEREPNNDGLNANLIDLGKQVKAAIQAKTDGDVYTFTTPATYRDWMHIELQNLSTTLDPHLELFDGTKASIGSTSNTTAGGDVGYDFVAPPAAKFSVRVTSHYKANMGVYTLRIVPKKAYDAHEPNDDILSARRIAEATPVKAGLMDRYDTDYFSVPGTANGDRTLVLTIANASATLHPRVVVYDAAKTEIGSSYNATAGGDLSYTIKTPKGPVYIRISDHFVSDGGDYTLTVAPQ